MRPLAQLQAVPLPGWTADELAALRRACAPPSLELCNDDERERIRYELGEFAGDGFRPGRAVDPGRIRLRDPIHCKDDRPHAGDVVHFPEDGGHYSASGYGIVGGGSLPYVTLNCAPPFREAGPGYQVTQEHHVSASGGPCPWLDGFRYELAGSCLVWAWNWGKRDIPGAGRAVFHTYRANVWRVVGKAAEVTA